MSEALAAAELTKIYYANMVHPSPSEIKQKYREMRQAVREVEYQLTSQGYTASASDNDRRGG